MADAAEEIERHALRARLGAGARFDSPAAPARELAWARRGTAYFARKLNELDNGAIDDPSLAPGWSRRHVIAHVGYHARDLARLVEWARTRREPPERITEEERAREVELAATLPPEALRHLFRHSEIHLNVEWRDLDDEGWEFKVQTHDGRLVPARETVWMRAQEIWLRTFDLGNGGRFSDFPPELLFRWLNRRLFGPEGDSEAAGLPLTEAAAVGHWMLEADSGLRISARLPELVRWISGRGTRGLEVCGGELPEDPAPLVSKAARLRFGPVRAPTRPA